MTYHQCQRVHAGLDVIVTDALSIAQGSVKAVLECPGQYSPGGEGRGREKEEQMKKGLEFCSIHGPGEGSDLSAT